jgi:hypothetical protein
MSVQQFTDLAGSHFLTIPKNASEELIIESLSYLRLTKTSKIKVIFDTYDLSFIYGLLVEFANNSNFKINIEPYNSNFFVFNREQARIWLDNNPLQNFVTKQILCQDSDNIEVVKNLQVNSFAIKITKGVDAKTVIEDDEIRAKAILDKFEGSYTQKGLKTYLVKSKLNEIVGCFSLIKTGNEVQLSGVAGRTNLNNSFKGKKLIILCHEMLCCFLSEQEFKDTDYLTLSNSKLPIAQMYLDLNIPKNESRKGLLFQSV